MTAQSQSLTSEHSAFDSISSWLHGKEEDVVTNSGSAQIITDVKVLYQRVNRTRKAYSALASIELSPYVKNLVKMVGAMEIIDDPPSQRSLS